MHVRAHAHTCSHITRTHIHARMQLHATTRGRGNAHGRCKGTDNRGKGTANRGKGTNNRGEGTDNRDKGTDNGEPVSAKRSAIAVDCVRCARDWSR
jgi:hypothetical protein